MDSLTSGHLVQNYRLRKTTSGHNGPGYFVTRPSASLPVQEMPPESEVQANFDRIGATLEKVGGTGGTVRKQARVSAVLPAIRGFVMRASFMLAGTRHSAPSQKIDHVQLEPHPP